MTSSPSISGPQTAKVPLSFAILVPAGFSGGSGSCGHSVAPGGGSSCSLDCCGPSGMGTARTLKEDRSFPLEQLCRFHSSHWPKPVT